MGGDLHDLRAPLSCPPTVLEKVLKQETISGGMPYSESKYVSPTDGVPVKVFAHKGLQRKEQHNCDSCCEEIVRFLAESLRISAVGMFHVFFISLCLRILFKSSFLIS